MEISTSYLTNNNRLTSYIKAKLSEALVQIPILVLLCFLLFLLNLNGIDLWGSDEPRYAEIAREMVADGNWVVPHFNGKVYFNKPPLFFWFVGLFSLIGGEVTELTARLPAALMGLGTALVVYFLGKRLVNQRVGFFAALMLATSPQFHKYARLVRLDLPFTFFITLAMASFFYGRTAVRQKKWYFLAFWFFMGLATLLKGPLGIFLPLSVIFFYLLFNKELKFFKQIQPLAGAIIFLFVVFAWFIPAHLSGGSEYTEGNTVRNGFLYLINPWNHSETFYYYFPELLVGAAPWSLFLPSALILCFSQKHTEIRKRMLFPAFWLLVIFIIFTLGLSKRAGYLLPLYPAVAILVAIFWDDFLNLLSLRRSRLMTIPVYVLIASMILGTGLFPILMYHKHNLNSYSFLIAFCMLSLAIFFFVLFHKRKYNILLISIIIAALIPEILTDQIFLPRQNKYESEKPACEKIASIVGTNGSWAVYKEFRNTYPFYVKNYPKRINNREDLAAFLGSSQQVYCLIAKREYQELQKEEKIVVSPLCPITTNGKELLLVTNENEIASLRSQ
ncbi:MAG TPA: ArnT family glycosyltransferase [Candidatus Brocadiia bacterium]|nr:glycosyltransferase family 39 protein [Candidatus Brocadiales bacterium]